VGSAVRIPPLRTGLVEPSRSYDWLEAVRTAAQELGPDGLVVAHSLGFLPVAHLAGQGLSVRRVVLVAPPDVHGATFPSSVAVGFTDLAPAPLKVPMLVISSRDDPYCTPAATGRLVSRWQAEHVEVGAQGHLNESSGRGDWEQGWEIVQDFATPGCGT
jgi:predicted alpha/beta hydrolase family esterase